MQRLDGGSGGSQNECGAVAFRHPFRHIAGLVTRSLVLLVRGLVLLVDNDDAHIAQRCEQRTAGADHHARTPGPDEIPLVVTLPLAHARVHDGDRMTEAATETGDCLGSQADFGHQDQCRLMARHHLFDGAEVHLRLAGTGYAVDNYDMAVARVHGAFDSVKRRLLAIRQTGAIAHHVVFRRLGSAFIHTAQTAAALHGHNALSRKRLQRLAHGAVLHGQLRHPQFAMAQRIEDCALLDRVRTRRERFGIRTQLHPAIVHFADLRRLDLPAAADVHHTRNASRRREEPNADGKRRDITPREKPRACGTVFIEVRTADHLMERL